MDTEEAEKAERLYGKLAKQWAWLDAHEDHPEAEDRVAIFLRTVEKYEQACREIEEPPCPSA